MSYRLSKRESDCFVAADCVVKEKMDNTDVIDDAGKYIKPSALSLKKRALKQIAKMFLLCLLKNRQLQVKSIGFRESCCSVYRNTLTLYLVMAKVNNSTYIVHVGISVQ